MTTTRTRAPKPAERKPARRKAAPKPVEVISEPKPATGPRGELLARVGLAEDGYVIKLPFREFETLPRRRREGGYRGRPAGLAHPVCRPRDDEARGHRHGGREGWRSGRPAHLVQALRQGRLRLTVEGRGGPPPPRPPRPGPVPLRHTERALRHVGRTHSAARPGYRRFRRYRGRRARGLR